MEIWNIQIEERSKTYARSPAPTMEFVRLKMEPTTDAKWKKEVKRAK